MSPYYIESVKRGIEFQKSNKSWAGHDVIKYQKQIKDLVDRYQARNLLDYGCGKGQQYREPLPYGGGPGIELPQSQWQTFDQYLGVKVYCYDPCVEGFDKLPPPGSKFDGVICTQVLNSIPDDDMAWVRDLLQSYAQKFCFIGVNFQREAKGKKAYMTPSISVNRAHAISSGIIIEIGRAVIFFGGGKIDPIIRIGSAINSTVLGPTFRIHSKVNINS